MEILVGMRVGYILLTFTIVFVCMWFFHESTRYKAYYRTSFFSIMVMAALLYTNRVFQFLLEKGVIQSNDVFLTLERMIYYYLIFGIFCAYAFFILCLFDQFQYYPKWKILLFLLPAVIISIMVITSPWTHWIFYVENGVTYKGIFYTFGVLVAMYYGIFGSLHAFRKRKLFPKVFGECVVLVLVLTFIHYINYVITQDEILLSVALLVGIVIYMLALTTVDFYKDTTTNLFNKEAFEQYVKKEIGKGNDKTVYLIKLKNYEYLKENCHEIPLQSTIRELAECIRKYSKLPSIYYLGGGKFTVIVPKHSKFTEEEFLKRLRERFCIPFDVNGASIQLTLFIAIMNLQNGKINRTNFTKYYLACDEMKYRSNDLLEIIHGDNFGIDQLQRYHQVEEAIERALVEHEFKVFYQPIVSTKTKKIVSAEALLRLNDRVLGFISPEEFIPISESNGKIIEISDYVIDSVFRFIKENDLEKLGLDFIEVNLSMIQCMDKKLPDKLKFFLEKYEINPKFVNLEITETATNYDEERLRQQLFDIKKLGFSFSLDDYGTGYSNLVRVLEYPVDMIKLDKSIVWSAFHVQDNYVTMKNLISMFHDVRRKIVAEGVESEEQMQALNELGCDYLQGYYYSKPIVAEDFLRFTARFNA